MITARNLHELIRILDDKEKWETRNAHLAHGDCFRTADICSHHVAPEWRPHGEFIRILRNEYADFCSAEKNVRKSTQKSIKQWSKYAKCRSVVHGTLPMNGSCVCVSAMRECKESMCIWERCGDRNTFLHSFIHSIVRKRTLGLWSAGAHIHRASCYYEFWIDSILCWIAHTERMNHDESYIYIRIHVRNVFVESELRECHRIIMINDHNASIWSVCLCVWPRSPHRHQFIAHNNDSMTIFDPQNHFVSTYEYCIED